RGHHRVLADRTYRVLGMRWYAKGAFLKDELPGSLIKAKHLFKVQQGDFVYNRLFAWKGSFAVIEEDCEGGYVSGEFPCFQTPDMSDAYYLWMLFSQPWVWGILESQSAGSTSTSRLRLREDVLSKFLIPVPSERQRREMVASLRTQFACIVKARS